MKKVRDPAWEEKIRDIAWEGGFYIALFVLGMLFQQYIVTPRLEELSMGSRLEQVEKTVSKLCDIVIEKKR